MLASHKKSLGKTSHSFGGENCNWCPFWHHKGPIANTSCRPAEMETMSSSSTSRLWLFVISLLSSRLVCLWNSGLILQNVKTEALIRRAQTEHHSLRKLHPIDADQRLLESFDPTTVVSRLWCSGGGVGFKAGQSQKLQWPVVVGHQLERSGWQVERSLKTPPIQSRVFHRCTRNDEQWAHFFLSHTKSQQCGWKTGLTFENCLLLPLLDYTLTIVDRCRNRCFSLLCHCSGPSSNWHVPRVHTLAMDGVWQWYRFNLLPFTSLPLLLPHVWWWKPKVLIKHW